MHQHANSWTAWVDLADKVVSDKIDVSLLDNIVKFEVKSQKQFTDRKVQLCVRKTIDTTQVSWSSP